MQCVYVCVWEREREPPKQGQFYIIAMTHFGKESHSSTDDLVCIFKAMLTGSLKVICQSVGVSDNVQIQVQKSKHTSPMLNM